MLLKVHRGQWEPFQCKTRFRVVVAGRRWGKTHWICIELIKEAIAGEKRKVWYVAPTYSMAKQIAWEKLKEIIPLDWVAKNHMGQPAINETMLSVKLINGSIIALKGADRPDTLRGVGIHFLAMDEFQDMKKEVWTALRPTLTDTAGRAVFIGTPKSFNHLYEFYQRGNRLNPKRNPQWTSWQFKTSDSPFIAKSEIVLAMEDMDPKTFRQEYEASFETMAGRVYYDFDRRVNVRVSPFDPSMPTMIGQDFNVDPMSTVLLQRHGEEIWVTGELSLRSSSTEDVCRTLLNEYGWGFRDVATVYPDPAGNNRTSARGESDIQIFREWGFNRILFRPKHPAVRDRIAAVNRMICDAKGVRRLYVDPSCTHLINSFEQTVYKDGTGDVDKKAGAEHMTDAIGYPIEYEFPVKSRFKPVGYSH
ncbi:MAG: terminase family protein [Alphaproteobacteria bacterium]|nr:terminase family protein [Alphaproteobacteria bacterium]